MAPKCASSVLAAALVLLATTASASDPTLSPHRRVRGLSPDVETMIRNAANRSPTIRQLLDTLERSDLIVYVQCSIAVPIATGKTAFITKSGGTRFLLVSLNKQNHPDTVMANLGHELQHAVEVAQAPEVVDENSLRKLYMEIGLDSREDSRFETMAAIQTTRVVVRELAGMMANGSGGSDGLQR